MDSRTNVFGGLMIVPTFPETFGTSGPVKVALKLLLSITSHLNPGKQVSISFSKIGVLN